MEQENLKKGLSFIVCCHNSEDRIADTFFALKLQENDGIPFEVILVDNNCTDRTVSIAKKMWDRPDADLIVVAEKTPGVVYARKKGAACAGYKYFSFIDDDNSVGKKWVKKVVRLFEEKTDVGMIGSCNEATIDGDIPLWFKDNQKSYACGPQLPFSGQVNEDRSYLWGAGLSVRSEIAKKALASDWPLYFEGRKGNALSSGEDTEFCMRIFLSGWKLWYASDLRLKHRIVRSRLCWKYFCRLQAGFGVCSPILHIYRNLIRGTSPRSYTVLICLRLKRLSFLLLRYNFRLLFSQEGRDFKKEFCFEWAYFKSLILLAGRYQHVYRDIQKNCSKFGSLKQISPDN